MLEKREAARRIGVLDQVAAITTAGAVAVRAVEPQSRFVLRLAATEAARVGRVAGLNLAGSINRANVAQERTAARLGPDEWLLLAPAGDAAVLGDVIGEALAGCHYTLVDISHRNAAVEISGPAAAAVLNAGCPLDLGLDKFKAGDATRTLFGKVEIVLLRLENVHGEPRYRIEFWRSFGRFLHAYLAEATREFS
ncbi:MAG: sarcosine oxidase subunit gamma family protein [Hyphomicrobiaceae bacterium]